MKVYVSVDMEGIAGVVHVDQTRRAGHDYDKARRWMTAEANAAALGAFDGGASSVVVNDAHGDMRNLLLEELDPRVEILSGALKPLSMVQGVSRDHAVALFVGYHAGAGSHAGILDHTYYGRVVARCRVGDRAVSETFLNAIACGEAGVPVGLVTGDSTACRQAREELGDAAPTTLVVKEAVSRYSARSIHPEAARGRIREASRKVVERARDGALVPFRPKPPHRLEIDFVNSGCADIAELVPGTVRTSGTSTAYDCRDGATLLQVIQAWTILAGATMP